MTLLEKKSKRKALAIRTLVESGEYSPSYALEQVESLNDNGKLLDIDYEPLAEWLESLINGTTEEEIGEVVEQGVEE